MKKKTVVVGISCGAAFNLNFKTQSSSETVCKDFPVVLFYFTALTNLANVMFFLFFFSVSILSPPECGK